MTTGILDSLATLKLVTFLEQKFDDHGGGARGRHRELNTIDQIVDLVNTKL